MRPQRGRAKRQQLLRDAAEVLVRRGFDGAAKRDDAGACGVGKGMLSERFPPTEDRSIDRRLGRFPAGSEDFECAVANSASPAASLVDALCHQVAETLWRLPRYSSWWGRLSFDERFRAKCRL